MLYDLPSGLNNIFHKDEINSASTSIIYLYGETSSQPLNELGDYTSRLARAIDTREAERSRPLAVYKTVVLAKHFANHLTGKVINCVVRWEKRVGFTHQSILVSVTVATRVINEMDSIGQMSRF